MYSLAKEVLLFVTIRLFRCWFWEDRLVQSHLLLQHWDHVFDGVWTYYVYIAVVFVFPCVGSKLVSCIQRSSLARSSTGYP